MKRFLYFGHYISIGFGLALIISSFYAIIIAGAEYFQSDFESAWGAYKANLFALIKPIAIFNIIALILIKILSIWFTSIQRLIIDELNKPIDRFFEE